MAILDLSNDIVTVQDSLFY